MSSNIYRTILVFVVIYAGVESAPKPQQAYLPPSPSVNTNTFYVPPQPAVAAEGSQQNSVQIPKPSFLESSSSNQIQQQQQQLPASPPIQLHIPIPNDGVDEKKIYVQLPPQPLQQFPQQSPQYRYPPRKHYKIILVRSPSPPTPAPAPILPEIEEQTLVYVLVKKPDTPSVAELQQQQQQSYKLNKPEVYFIKYKANEQRANSYTNDASLGIGGSLGAEKSIVQQVSNNLESGAANGSEGYSYNGVRKRETKNLDNQEEVKTVAEEEGDSQK